MMCKVTVVITTYNLENHIERCLKEILNQTMTNFEVLIIDDCSKDNTVKIIEKYRELFDGRLKTEFLSKNLGSPAKARNVALNSKKISGKYVVFLDGDDSIEKNFIERLYETAEKNKSDIVLSSYDRIEEGTGHVLCTEMKDFPETIVLPPNSDILAFINGSLWNKLIKTKIIEDSRIPDFKVGEDLAFQQALFRKCKKICCIEDVLIHYNVRSSSIISNTEEDTIHQFAIELLKNYNDATNNVIKRTIGLTIFIHIGISMAIRAYDNQSIDIKNHLKWTRNLLFSNKELIDLNSFLKLKSLKKHGIRGLAIWGCKLLYKCHCFIVFLIFYRIITKIFRMDFKF